MGLNEIPDYDLQDLTVYLLKMKYLPCYTSKPSFGSVNPRQQCSNYTYTIIPSA